MNVNDLTTSGLFNPNLRMNSLEIAELMGKEHFHVKRDIRELIDQEAIDTSRFGLTSYIDSMNREQSMYQLDFESTMLLITGYDANRRAKVIHRWMQLERGEALPAASLHETLCDVPVINNLISTVANLLTNQGKLDARLYRVEKGAAMTMRPRIASSSVIPFVKEVYRRDSNAATNKELVYGLYRQFCEQTATIVEPRDTFFKILYQQGLPIRPGKLSVKGEVTRVIRGFGIKGDRPDDRQLELFPAGVLGGGNHGNN